MDRSVAVSASTDADIAAEQCVRVTMCSCSEGCVRNTGLPCEHLFALFRKLPNFNASLSTSSTRSTGSSIWRRSRPEDDVFVDASSAAPTTTSPASPRNRPPRRTRPVATSPPATAGASRWPRAAGCARIARWSTPACEAIALVQGVAQTLAEALSAREAPRSTRRPDRSSSTRCCRVRVIQARVTAARRTERRRRFLGESPGYQRTTCRCRAKPSLANQSAAFLPDQSERGISATDPNLHFLESSAANEAPTRSMTDI